MIYIYRESDGLVSCEHPDFVEGYIDKVFKNPKYVKTEKPLENFWEYKYVGGEFIKLSKQEEESVRSYGKILSEEEYQAMASDKEEEALLNKLKPTREEVMKAELMLELTEVLGE